MSPYKTLLLIGVLCGFAANGYAQSELIADSKIESVTVYPDSARITRTFDLAIESGETECYFRYLPDSVEASTIKALTESMPGQLAVRDVTVKIGDSDIEDHPKLVQLREKSESLKTEISGLDNQLTLLKERKSYAGKMLSSFAEGFGQGEGTLPESEDVEAVWSFYEKTTVDAENRIDELEAQLKPLQKAFDANQTDVEKLLNNLQRCRTTAVVLIDSTASGNIALELQYQVFGCSWQPMYELRAEPSNQKVNFRYYAGIQQNSGEDWENVALKLSTSRATNWGNVPELYPIRLNKVEPVVMRQPMAVMKEAVRTDAVYEMDASGVGSQKNAASAAPVFDALFSSFEVMLPQSFTVRTGKGSRKALLTETVMNGDFWTEVVPKYNEKGYLMAEVENSFEWPILRGNSTLFVENQMVGKGFLRNTPIGEKIELSLGTNENITVERKIGKQNEIERGLLGKKTQLTRQYFTVVKNHSGSEQRLKIKDQFPISENEKIEVKRIVPNEKEAEFEDDTGIYTIELTLKPGQERELETRFDVIYPEDWMIPEHF